MNVNHYFKKIVLGLGIALMVGAGFFLFSQKTVAQNEPVCTIKNAIFDPYTAKDTFLETFHLQTSPRQVQIKITTENCSGKEVFVDLRQDKVLDPSISVPVKNRNGTQMLPKKFTVPESENFLINLLSGESYCGSFSAGDGFLNGGVTTGGADCTYFINAVFTGATVETSSSYNSRDQLYGNLDYECDGTACADAWLYLSDTSKKDSSAIELEDGQIIGSVSEACAGQGEDCYELYGGLADAFGNKITTISTANDDSLGGFLNMIIAFATGIAGIIVVARIFYLGIKFMAVRKESNAPKLTSVKAQILKTLLGLVLLLGIYVILRTINPDLLNLTPRVDAITFTIPPNEDVDSFLEKEITRSPDIAKIYARTKGNMRDGGSLIPANESARRTMANSIPQSSLTDLTTLGLTIKAGTGKYLDSGVAAKLGRLNNTLKENSVRLIVTEGFKPSIYRHFAACHYKATCVDADIPFNANHVAFVISEASKNGLIAVWETKNGSDVAKLEKIGVPASNIIYFKGNHITGDHFSIYEFKP